MNTERLEEESNVTQGVAVTEPVMKVKKKIDEDQIEDQIEERVMEVFDRVFGERLAEAMDSCKED